MSGEKESRNVCLTNTEYNNMRNAMSRVGNIENEVERNVQQRMNALNTQYNSSIQATNTRLEQYNSRLSNQLQQIDREHTAALIRQNERLRNEMNTVENRLNYRIEQRYSELDNRLNETRIEFSEMMDEIDERVSSLEQNFSDAGVYTRDSLDDISVLFEQIAQFNPERYKPGELSVLRQKENAVRAMLEQGQGQSAYGMVSPLLVDTMRLRDQVFAMETEWQEYLNGARQAAIEAKETCEQQSQARFEFTTEEGTVEINGRVDYWTNGRLSEIAHRIGEIESNLNTTTVDNMTVDQFRDSIREAAEHRTEAESLSEPTKSAILASQTREYLAQDIAIALPEEWDIIDSTYQNGETNGTYYAQFRNTTTGDEVVIRIEPLNNESVNIGMDFFPTDVADERLSSHITRQFRDYLVEQKIPMPEFHCRQGSEGHSTSRNANLRDLQGVKKPVSKN